MSLLKNTSDSKIQQIGSKHKIFKPITEIRKCIEDICSSCEKRSYICGVNGFYPEYCEKVDGILSNQ